MEVGAEANCEFLNPTLASIKFKESTSKTFSGGCSTCKVCNTGYGRQLCYITGRLKNFMGLTAVLNIICMGVACHMGV